MGGLCEERFGRHVRGVKNEGWESKDGWWKQDH